MNRLDNEQLETGVDNGLASTDCARGCGGDCGRCRGEVEPGPDEADLLTRGLLDSFSSFIATGEPKRHDGDDEPQDQVSFENPQASAMDMALGRMEAALDALASAMPELASRLSSVEARVDEVESIEWVEPEVSLDAAGAIDRVAVADSLKDRLNAVRRECDRLSNVPSERIETRVAAAEESLGSLVERAEAAARVCQAERRAAESVCERLETLASALTPWVELLEFRETEDGLPRPMAALLRLAGEALVREVSCVRVNMDRVAGVLGLAQAACPPASDMGTEILSPDVVQVEGPMEFHESDADQPERKRGRPARAVRSKGADAETPRRASSQKRLAAEARLRARTRVEGRPPRR